MRRKIYVLKIFGLNIFKWIIVEWGNDHTDDLSIGAPYLYPLYHRGCGGSVAWFTVKPEPGMFITADRYCSLDGTMYKAEDVVKETCPKCGKVIGLNEMHY